MATTQEQRDLLLQELNFLEGITYRPMMGEYCLYYQGVLIGGIYDGVFLIKETLHNEIYQLEEVIPYEGAKKMYLIDDFSNSSVLKEIIEITKHDLEKK